MNDHLQPKPTQCVICGITFDASLRNRGKGIHRYCSKKCRTKADNARHYARRGPKRTEAELRKTCVQCGIPFQTDQHHPNAMTCSVKCNEARMNWKRRQKAAERFDVRAELECVECGKAFQPSKFARGDTRFCSNKCARRVATRAFRARAKQRDHDPRLTGPAWKAASKAARERDGHACQICGVEDAGGRLNVHHKLNRMGIEDNDHGQDNLVTLCISCHRKFHDIRIGMENGQYVISGLALDWLKIDAVQVVHTTPQEA